MCKTRETKTPLRAIITQNHIVRWFTKTHKGNSLSVILSREATIMEPRQRRLRVIRRLLCLILFLFLAASSIRKFRYSVKEARHFAAESLIHGERFRRRNSMFPGLILMSTTAHKGVQRKILRKNRKCTNDRAHRCHLRIRARHLHLRWRRACRHQMMR